MDVGRTDGVQGAGRIDPVGGPRKLRKSEQTAPTSSAADKVEISEGARLISEVLSMPGTRSEKIESIRKLIESGQYETDARMEGAIEELLKDNPELLG